MQKEFRIIVCGGRDYGWVINSNRKKTMNAQEVKFMFDRLDILRQSVEELGRTLIVIQGEADGADSWAKKWAETNDILNMGFSADWDTYKKAAGAIRNKQMLAEGKPDLVVAFKGGKGTSNMIEQSEKAKVPVRKY
jgi:deoxyribodipyrimidine photolyase